MTGSQLNLVSWLFNIGGFGLIKKHTNKQQEKKEMIQLGKF